MSLQSMVKLAAAELIFAASAMAQSGALGGQSSPVGEEDEDVFMITDR